MGMRHLLRDAGFDYFKPLPCRGGGAVIMDIKGYGGMNGFEQIAASGPSMLLGDPCAFFRENFAPETANVFFSTPPEEDKCADCWLWTIPEDAEDGNSGEDTPGIWHMLNESMGSPERDFLLACRQADIDVKSCTLTGFMDKAARNGRRDQFIYGGLSGETLFAMLGTSLPKILDYRSIEDETYRKDALKLHVILAGCQARDNDILPLPFSTPQGFPCFEQRAHIVLCFNDPLLVQICQSLKETDALFSDTGLFYLSSRRQSYKNFYNLTRDYLFPLRNIFKAVIFTAWDWAEAAYFISGGTPGILLGPLPGGEFPNCLLPAQTPSEAMYHAERLVKDRKLWEKMAARVRFYSRSQFRHFKAELEKLFPST